MEKANLFNNYFNSVFSKSCKEPVPPGRYPIVTPLGELSIVVISVKEVERILKNLDPSKSPDSDGLTLRLLKEVASEISCPITDIFNKSLNNGITAKLNECKTKTFSQKTVQRVLYSEGYKRWLAKKKMVVREANRKKRVKWYKQRRSRTVENYRKKVIFSD